MPSHQYDESNDYNVEQTDWQQVFPLQSQQLVDTQTWKRPFKPHDDQNEKESF